MTAAHVKTAMAALALAGTPEHLRASHGIALGAGTASMPAAGAGPQGAAPRAADPDFSWDDVVANCNSTLPSAATAHLGQAAASHPPAAASAQVSAGFSWDDIVTEHNARNGFNQGDAQ